VGLLVSIVVGRYVSAVTNHEESDLAVPDGSDSGARDIRLEVLASVCIGGTCPTVYRSDRRTFVVQGYAVSGESAQVDLHAGESLVEIPMDLLIAALNSGGVG
jgi:hypothetical protein